MEEIAPEGLTEQEERALLEAKIIVSHVAERHEGMVRWTRNGESVNPADLPAKWQAGDPPPMTPPTWKPESTIFTAGRPMEKAEFEAWKKENGVVETSKAELRRAPSAPNPKLNEVEREKILEDSIEQGKKYAHMLANGETPPPLEETNTKWKPADPARPVPVEDLTDGGPEAEIIEPGRGSNATVVPGTGERIPTNEELDKALYESIQWR